MEGEKEGGGGERKGCKEIGSEGWMEGRDEGREGGRGREKGEERG